MRQINTSSQIVAISTAVPKFKFNNINYDFLEKEKIKNFIKITGVESRRITKGSLCTSDLAIKAGEKIIKNLNWSKDSIDFIIFISQTSDYLTPATSIILQDKLNLKNNLFTIDINLGCSGFPYGISFASSLIDSMGFNRGILFIGDVSSKLCNIKDKSTWPLFGDACSAIAFERKKKNKVFFDFFSDGSRFDDIIVPSHSMAGKIAPKKSSFDDVDKNGLKRNSFNMHLNGANIYSFAISKVHERINNLIKFSLIKKKKY